MSNISEIIARHIVGKDLSDEEEAAVSAWRKESAENEAAFQRLMDTDFLEGEWRKRKSVNWQRAAEQMKGRIGERKTFSLRGYLFRAAAAIALLVVGGVTATYLFNDEPAQTVEVAEHSRPTLRAGEMKAVLTLANGEEITLTNNDFNKDEPISAKELLANHQTSLSTLGEDMGGTSLSLSVPRGGEFRIELEDGTEVWLNAQSQLIYPESFSDTERRVQVEGEAYFRVAKNEEKPFYVETAGQVVRVVGTEFNVHGYAEDQTVQTTLVNGQVAMQRQGDTSREMVLTPGHQAVFDKAGGSIRIKSVDTEVVTSWKDGMFVFEDMTLADIMLTLSRWYDFDYEFRDPQLATIIFMGRIPRYSDFASVMEIIELSGGLNLRLTGRHLIIEPTK